MENAQEENDRLVGEVQQALRNLAEHCNSTGLEATIPLDCGVGPNITKESAINAMNVISDSHTYVAGGDNTIYFAELEKALAGEVENSPSIWFQVYDDDEYYGRTINQLMYRSRNIGFQPDEVWLSSSY